MMKVHSSCVAFPLWADKRGLQQGNKNKTFHLLHHESSSVQDKELFVPLLISTPRLSQILPPLILFNLPFLYTLCPPVMPSSYLDLSFGAGLAADRADHVAAVQPQLVVVDAQDALVPGAHVDVVIATLA